MQYLTNQKGAKSNGNKTECAHHPFAHRYANTKGWFNQLSQDVGLTLFSTLGVIFITDSNVES